MCACGECVHVVCVHVVCVCACVCDVCVLVVSVHVVCVHVVCVCVCVCVAISVHFPLGTEILSVVGAQYGRIVSQSVSNRLVVCIVCGEWEGAGI